MTRRAMLGGAGRAIFGISAMGAAAPMAAHPYPAEVTASSGRLVSLRGTRLWVEDSGPANAPVLLYLHGGPGVGSYEFSAYAAPYLRRDWRLVVFDQRGVLRSDPIPAGATFSLDDLVADVEALRNALGIARWSVLGHSFGGHYALRCALAHPDRVERLYLENAGFSFPESWRSGLEATAALYRQLGQAAQAAKCQAVLAAPPQGAAMLATGATLMANLGEHRQDLYIYNPANRGFFGRLQARSELPDDRWNEGQRQAELLIVEGRILEPMLSHLSAWNGPTIMLKGETDHAASAPESAAVASRPGGRVLPIERSGHFSHVEQPALFAKRVLEARGR